MNASYAKFHFAWLFFREELHGIPRGGKDVKWDKIARSRPVTTLPPPVPIDVNELLKNLHAPKLQAETALTSNDLNLPTFNGKFKQAVQSIKNSRPFKNLLSDANYAIFDGALGKILIIGWVKTLC